MPLESQLGSLNLVIRFDRENPVPERILYDTLIDAGYELSQQEGDDTVVASSGSHQVVYQPEESTITAYLSDVGSLPDVSESIKNILEEKLPVTLSQIHSVRVSVDELIWSEGSTIDAFDGMYPEIELGEHFDAEPVPISVRFASSKDPDPDDSDLYDLTVEAYVRNPNYYFINLDFVKPSFNDIAPFAEDMHESIATIINNIESAEHGHE